MQSSITEIDSFETMLLVALADKKTYLKPESVLSLSDAYKIQKSCLTKRLFIRLALMGLGTALGTAAVAEAQEPERTILMRRVVPANFHEPDFDSAKFQKFLENSTNRTVKVKPNSTVSSILKDQFNVSQSWTPSVYDQLHSHVLSLNDIQDPARDLKAGQTLKLPDLPRTSQVYTKPGKPANSQTKSSILSKWDKKAGAFTGFPKMSPNSPGTAATELQIRKIPLSALKNLQLPNANTNLTDLIENNDWQPMQEAMTLTFAGDPKEAKSATLLTQPEKDILKEFLARPAKTRPILFILDDSIPSRSDFLHTVEFIIKASREIRQKFGLQDATHGDSPTLLDIEKTYRQGTSFCDEDCEYPKLKLHSAMVRESLKELGGVDSSQRVEVIYLPVNRAQLFSKELLTEILSVALLADSVTSGLVLSAPGITVPANVKRGKPDYSSIAPQVETILESKSLSSPLQAYNGTDMISTSDKGIIDGVVNFLWLYSMASQRPHFLSMSWTTPNLQYPTLFRPNGYGLWLAAAGNDPKINIHSDLRQFAARSSDPGDVLAVANLAESCKGSKFTDDPDVPVFGFAFPGRISPALCGTSFSTPRLAWLLAAHEAIKGKPYRPDMPEWYQWRVRKKTKLMSLQNINQTGEARYIVSLWQLLEEPTPGAVK